VSQVSPDFLVLPDTFFLTGRLRLYWSLR